MATMISEVYDALRDAQGVSEEKARKAAEAIAAYDQRFIAIERKIDGLDAKLDRVQAGLDAKIDRVQASLEQKIDRVQASLEQKIEEVRGTQRTQQWMLGTIVAGMVALLIRAFT